MKNGTPLIKNKKLRYGSLSVLLTAAIVAAVVIFNVIFSSLAAKHLWYVDLTSDSIYTLSDAGINYLTNSFDKANEERAQKGEKQAEVKIIFCDEPDVLESNELQRIVYVMAKELAKQFPDTVSVEWVDIIKNPSAVQAYGKPKTTSVIIASGSEYRTVSLRNFYVFDTEDSSEPWAYKAERTFAVSIAAVIQSETPVACWTVNHGEQMYDSEIINLVYDAGYEIRTIDLATEEIPEDCRLMITFNPQSDFLSSLDGVSTISEIKKLDAFLDSANSYMVFTDASTPKLPNLEEYLEEWGISYARVSDSISVDGEETEFNYMLKDTSKALSVDGFTFIGEYETKGFGGSVTSDMRSGGVPKKVIFSNASAIVPSKQFELQNYHDDNAESGDTSGDYYYYSYYANGVSRDLYNIFTTSANAVAMANGKEVDVADEHNKFSLMTLSVESRTIQDDNYNTQSDNTYVLACSSTQFLSAAFLQSAVYGNSDLLMSTMRAIGREIVPVGLSLIPFSSTQMQTITTTEATQYTVALSVVPAVIMFGLGLFVMIRRKYS